MLKYFAFLSVSTGIKSRTRKARVISKHKLARFMAPGVQYTQYTPELSMGWVDPRVGLGWVGYGSKMFVFSVWVGSWV